MRFYWGSSRGGGRLSLPGGGALRVKARRGEVRYHGGAIELSGVFPGAGEIEGIALTIEHPLQAPRHVFVPHLTPTREHVAGSFVFRSPAVIVADRAQAIAFVPDLDDVAAAQGYKVWIDYDHPSRRVTLCAGAYRADGHTFFVRERAACHGQRVKLRLHVITSTRPEDIENPYGMAARWLWRRWGRPAFAEKSQRPAPMERYIDWILQWAFSDRGWGETVWQELTLGTEPAGAPVFIVDVTQHPSIPPAERRWREPRSIWNQAWFSTQRCANGLYRHARHTGSEDLERRARWMTRIALAAPQVDGLFPSVLTCSGEGGWESARWTSSNRRPPSVSEHACHIVDAAFTCRMLLEWHALVGEPRALERASLFADRLVRLQRPSGAFPGWVEPDGRVPGGLAESAETAMSVSLLFDLGAEWHEAARAGARFLEGIIAEGRWEDFETYYSCSPWGAPELLGRRVPRSGVYKQNTLSIFWCAEAMLRAFRSSGEARYLRLARRCLDELSLYQAVWDPPFLTAPGHGGFGVMNADCEWNDARQSLFAPLYWELHRITGDPELFERGASALRASFSMLYCPENPALARAYERRHPSFGPETYGFMMENQGHDATDEIGTFTIFTWGNGSALAAAATARDRFEDLFRRAFVG